MSWDQLTFAEDLLTIFCERQAIVHDATLLQEQRFRNMAAGRNRFAVRQWYARNRERVLAARVVEDRNCLTCGTPFHPHGPQVRCSTKCRERAQNAGRPKLGTAPAWHWTNHRRQAA